MNKILIGLVVIISVLSFVCFNPAYSISSHYTILQNSNGTVLYDPLGNILSSNVDPSIPFQMAENYLSNCGWLDVGNGNYNIGKTDLWFPQCTTIQGNGDNTILNFSNGGAITVNARDRIMNMKFDFSHKTDSSSDFVISGGTYGRLQDLTMVGNTSNVILHLSGSPNNYVGNWDFDGVHVSGSNYNVRCDYCSNNNFYDLSSSGYKAYGYGLILCTADNNKFFSLDMNGDINTPTETEIYMGCSANDGTGDNTFFDTTLTAGDTNIVSNAVFNSTNHGDIRPNHFFYTGIDGQLNIVYNNHSQGQIDIEHTGYPLVNGK